MITIILTILMWIIAPIPWITIMMHVFIKNNKWKIKYIRKIVWFSSIFIWIILAWWFKLNYLLFFEQKFSQQIYIGIIFLIVATLIEINTTKILGRKRILGSSELKKSQDRLITSGIYRYARHPRYVEHPLWFAGFGLIFGYTYLLWFALYLFISFAIASKFEEQELIKRYDVEYLEYIKKTPPFFIKNKF